MKAFLRNAVADYLWIKSIRAYRSRLGRKDAPRYAHYLEQARRKSSSFKSTDAETRAEHFKEKGWSSYMDDEAATLAASMLSKIKAEENAGDDVWDQDNRYRLDDIYQRFPEVDALFKGPTGAFLRDVYGADFKIYYGVCYRSVHVPDGPQGSQHWHADGGPGTCINLMWCLSPVSPSNGAMECLSWNDTLKIFQNERKATRPKLTKENAATAMAARGVLTSYYTSSIDRARELQINQPIGDSGLVFAFSNNVLHKGGYPQAGQERYVCVFHIYPSAQPTPFDRYKSEGIAKQGSYPKDPAFGDVVR